MLQLLLFWAFLAFLPLETSGGTEEDDDDLTPKWVRKLFEGFDKRLSAIEEKEEKTNVQTTTTGTQPPAQDADTKQTDNGNGSGGDASGERTAPKRKRTGGWAFKRN